MRDIASGAEETSEGGIVEGKHRAPSLARARRVRTKCWAHALAIFRPCAGRAEIGRGRRTGAAPRGADTVHDAGTDLSTARQRVRGLQEPSRRSTANGRAAAITASSSASVKRIGMGAPRGIRKGSRSLTPRAAIRRAGGKGTRWGWRVRTPSSRDARVLVWGGATCSGKAFVSQCAPEIPIGATSRQKVLRYQQMARSVLNRGRPHSVGTSAGFAPEDAGATNPTDWRQPAPVVEQGCCKGLPPAARIENFKTAALTTWHSKLKSQEHL